jgi:hypothetical protein
MLGGGCARFGAISGRASPGRDDRGRANAWRAWSLSLRQRAVSRCAGRALNIILRVGKMLAVCGPAFVEEACIEEEGLLICEGNHNSFGDPLATKNGACDDVSISRAHSTSRDESLCYVRWAPCGRVAALAKGNVGGSSPRFRTRTRHFVRWLVTLQRFPHALMAGRHS